MREAAAALAAAAAAIVTVGTGGCRKETTLGAPDSFLIYAPAEAAAGAPLARSPGGLPIVVTVDVTDARAALLHKLFAVGFAAEMLRTDFLAKQLVRDAQAGGHRFPEPARAAAQEPTVVIVGPPFGGLGAHGAGLAVKGFWGGPVEHAGVAWLALERDPERDTAFQQTLAGLLARGTLRRLGAPPAVPEVLFEGYAGAMEVVAREWRVGEGPQDAMMPGAGTTAQRALFAGVRENEYTVGPDGAPRPPAELLADPGVAATVIYRMAQSKAVGRRVAPAEVYAPFVADRVPPGVSPAAVLGPFRNFQAKLLSAWGRAILEGKPPRDIAELVQAYGRAMPAERNEALRIFVVTTYGATVKPGGVRAAAATALPELTALSAEVAAGKRPVK